jgi:hypothetical protein
MLTALCTAQPVAALMTDKYFRLPMHYLCANPGVTPAALEILLGACGRDEFQQADAWGWLPLHLLCWNPVLRDSRGSKLFKIVMHNTGVAVDAPDAVMRTPMHCLAEGPSCVKDKIKELYAK